MPTPSRMPLPRVVGEHLLAHHLLRAVGGQRRQVEFVGDGVRKRRAEHRDRGGEDHAGLVAVAGLADRLEQRPGAVEVDVIALLQIDLGLAGHDPGEMEDHVRPLGDGLHGDGRIGEIAGPHLHMIGEAGRPGRGDDVHQRELFDRLAVQRAVDDQPLDQLAADHAGRAGDENVHSFPQTFPSSFRGRPKAGTRNPDIRSEQVSGFRARELRSRPGMTFPIYRPASSSASHPYRNSPARASARTRPCAPAIRCRASRNRWCRGCGPWRSCAGAGCLRSTKP